MRSEGWDTIVLSDPDHEHLVAELHHDAQFLLLLDREDGREAVCISFPDKDGRLRNRVPLSEFLERLRVAADDLNQ
ncbi:hypothetical protein ACNI65_08670 [Roseateles sp. So40a]|uniref:hypothetical protein n=1 Tax=Roseateles sp. So40a TaxID=3400226 RepID=UPI003A8835EA